MELREGTGRMAEVLPSSAPVVNHACQQAMLPEALEDRRRPCVRPVRWVKGDWRIYEWTHHDLKWTEILCIILALGMCRQIGYAMLWSITKCALWTLTTLVKGILRTGWRLHSAAKKLSRRQKVALLAALLIFAAHGINHASRRPSSAKFSSKILFFQKRRRTKPKRKKRKRGETARSRTVKRSDKHYDEAGGVSCSVLLFKTARPKYCSLEERATRARNSARGRKNWGG